MLPSMDSLSVDGRSVGRAVGIEFHPLKQLGEAYELRMDLAFVMDGWPGCAEKPPKPLRLIPAGARVSVNFGDGYTSLGGFHAMPGSVLELARHSSDGKLSYYMPTTGVRMASFEEARDGRPPPVARSGNRGCLRGRRAGGPEG